MSVMKISRISIRSLLSLHSRHLCTNNYSGDEGQGGGTVNSTGPSMYDCRKYGHNLPCNSTTQNFETLPNVPSGIFRCTHGEILGRGASKCGCYRNPEYFSFQHMTYYDMHFIMSSWRKPTPKTGRKP